MQFKCDICRYMLTPKTGQQWCKCPRCASENFVIWKDDAMNESDNPGHYQDGTIECIDAMRSALGKDGFRDYLRGTIMKYLWRYGKKDASAMEASKILVYAGWLCDNENDEPLRKKKKCQSVDQGFGVDSTGHTA